MVDNIYTNLINIDKAITQQRIAIGSPERTKQAFAGPVGEAKKLTLAAARQHDQQLLYNKRLSEAKQKEKRNARKREMEKLPTLDQAKIPPQDMAMITAESQGLRQQYLQNLQVMEQNDPFSDSYLQAKTSNDNILGEFQNINSTYTQLQTLSEEWLKAADDNMISDGMGEDDEEILDTILRKKYDKSYRKDGKLHWEWTDTNGNRRIINEDNLPQWFNKSKTGGTQYFNMWNKYTKLARTGTKYDDNTIKMQFRNLFDQIDGDGIISMAFDDISSTGQTFNDFYDNEFAGGTIEGPYMDWRDRGNIDELRERLVDWYSGHIENGMNDANKEYVNKTSAQYAYIGQAIKVLDDVNIAQQLIDSNFDAPTLTKLAGWLENNIGGFTRGVQLFPGEDPTTKAKTIVLKVSGLQPVVLQLDDPVVLHQQIAEMIASKKKFR